MRGFLPIFKRELLSQVVTPIAWVVAVAFSFVQGLSFYVVVSSLAVETDILESQSPIQAFFGQTAIFYFPLTILCPLLTMRLFAEERRSGTIETLLTAPVQTSAVVLGKYIAALSTYVALWAPTGLFMLILSNYGEIDLRIVFTGYLGTFLVGAAYIAIGTLASAMTTSQIVAAVSASFFIILLFVFGLFGTYFEPGPWRDLATHISVWATMDDFSRGLVDTRRLVFWGAFILVPVFVTTRVVDSWRWS